MSKIWENVVTAAAQHAQTEDKEEADVELKSDVSFLF